MILTSTRTCGRPMMKKRGVERERRRQSIISLWKPTRREGTGGLDIEPGAPANMTFSHQGSTSKHMKENVSLQDKLFSWKGGCFWDLFLSKPLTKGKTTLISDLVNYVLTINPCHLCKHSMKTNKHLFHCISTFWVDHPQSQFYFIHQETHSIIPKKRGTVPQFYLHILFCRPSQSQHATFSTIYDLHREKTQTKLFWLWDILFYLQ